MNQRVSNVVEAIKSLASACAPVLRPYRVSFFKKVPHGTQPGMVSGVWVKYRQTAYNTLDAAQKVVEKLGLSKKLRPGYNCYSTQIMPWEEDYDKPDGELTGDGEGVE